MREIWIPVSGQIAQQRKVETIANNLANANTTAYKKDDLVFKEYLTAHNRPPDQVNLPEKEWAPSDFYKSEGAELAFVKTDGQYTNYQQGDLHVTNNPLDVAIKGKGFFEVLTPRGIRYTRQGNFSLSPQGQLVTDQGHMVLASYDKALLDSQGREANSALPSPANRGINIPNNSFVSINKEGQIYSGNQPVGKISVVDFQDLNALRKDGHSLFVNSYNDNIRRDSNDRQIYQGHLEASNVNAIVEMSELIKAHRHFEKIQRAIKIYDDMAGKVSNDLAKF